MAMDGLRLPLRRPILFVPFLLAVLVGFGLLSPVGLGALVSNPVTQSPEKFLEQLAGILLGVGVLVLLVGGLLFVLAMQATNDLAARAELGRELKVTEAVRHALRRLLVSVAAGILLAVGLIPGFLLFIIPGIFLAVRWALVPQAIVVGGAGIFEAFGISWKLTSGHWWRFSSLGVMVGVGIWLLGLVLGLIPAVGSLEGWKLSFATN